MGVGRQRHVPGRHVGGVFHSFLERLLQVEVDRELQPVAVDWLELAELGDLAPAAVDRDHARPVAAAQQAVVAALHTRLPDHRARLELRELGTLQLVLLDLPDVAEEVRRKPAFGVLARRQLLDDDLGQIHLTRHHRRHLRHHNYYYL